MGRQPALAGTSALLIKLSEPQKVAEPACDPILPATIPRRWAGILAGQFAVLLLAIFMSALPAMSSPPSQHPAGLAPGPGVWMNLWNYPDNEEEYCSLLASKHVANLFVQTSRSNTEILHLPEHLGALIEACHRHHIRAIAWSFSNLTNPLSDAQRLVAAGRFRSLNGEGFDAVAGDIEKNLVPWRVETYSRAVREELGRTYPLIAVVYSPLNRAPEVSHTPWRLIARYWDTIAPMNYWGGAHQELDAYTYTVATIQAVKDLIGNAQVAIHVIGDGMRAGALELEQFFQACHDAGADGASIYPNQKVTDQQLRILSRYVQLFGHPHGAQQVVMSPLSQPRSTVASQGARAVHRGYQDEFSADSAYRL